MGFRDTLKFNPDKYARHLKDSSDHQLKKKHHQKCLEITTCEVSMGVGLGVAPHTLGISLVSSAYAFRQAIVLNEQKDLIEEECRSRNIPVPRERKRDVGIGLAVGVGTMGLGVAVPIGLDSLSGQAIAGAASTASIACSGVVHHLCPHAAGLANAASHGGHGVVHGIKETLTSQSHHLANHGTVGTSELYGTFQQLPSGVAGVNAGVLGTMKMEGFVGSQAGGNILASAGRKIVTPHY